MNRCNTKSTKNNLNNLKESSSCFSIRKHLNLALLINLIIVNIALAEIIPANPSTYRTLLTTLEPGDTLQLESGTYTLGLPVSNRHGTSQQPIIIAGPETGGAAVFTGNGARNTVQIDSSSYITLRYITLDGLQIPYVDGVNSRGPTHNIIIENFLIINHGGAYVPNTDHQLTNGIATRGPAWDWTIRNNTIIGAGTGIYFGNSTGRDWPFVGGLIEHNLIVDSLGYNMQIKHMVSRDYSNGNSVPGMPTIDRKTVIRHNVFSKDNNASTSGTWARPNLLVGHWPLSGAGSNDIYEIYGNFIYSNPAEALFQGEGNIAMYDNLLVNPSGSALHIQQHNDRPRTIRVFHNSVVATGTGIRVSNVDTEYDQLVSGNAIFAANPLSLSGQVQQVNNISDTFNSADNYLTTPFGDPELGTLDLYPLIGGTLSGSLIDNTLLQFFNDWNMDFNGNERQQGFRGAYVGDGVNPGWQLDLTIKPEAFTASLGAPDIIEGPLSTSAVEGGTASFNLRAGGSSQIQYQWFRNTDVISGATGASYTVNPVLAIDDGAVYTCEVSNSLGSELSNGAILTVSADTTAPIINGAVLRGLNAIDIQFSKTVTVLSAQTISNYQIDQGVQVLGASLSADMQTVQLQTDALMTDNVYTITINGILDTSSNANQIVANSKISIELESTITFENAALPSGWLPLTASRWSVVDESGDKSLFLNTTSYSQLSGSRLGEYILAPDIYTNFSLTVEAKTQEPSGNGNADYALVFGFQDANNYYYMLFNRTQRNTALSKVVNGTRQNLLSASENWLVDNEYHTVEVRRLLDNIEVRFDDNIVLQFIDDTFSTGQIGLGSFNDSAYFDNVRISNSTISDFDLIFANAFE